MKEKVVSLRDNPRIRLTRVCLNRANEKRGFGHEIALDMAISQFAHTPKPHRGCTSATLVRRFASDGITYALTSAPLFRNSIARGDHSLKKVPQQSRKYFCRKDFREEERQA